MDKFMTALTAMLKRHEGLRLEMYLDSASVPTIAYGHNLQEPISLEAANHILEDDIFTAMTELDRHKPLWRVLPHDARVVVANMMFNMGWPRYSTFVKHWAALADSNYRVAAIEMRDSRWYTQVGYRGEELAKLMEGVTGSVEV